MEIVKSRKTKEKQSELYGLILAGGKSTRMGSDKGLIDYHGKPQREYLFELASLFCEKVYYSAREDQLHSFSNKKEVILDQDDYQGPLNGIMSAHHAYPKTAFLVLACDLPLLNEDGLRELIEHRDRSKYATVFSKKDSGMPEPLIAIWEPEALREAKTYWKKAKSSSPKAYLLQSDIRLVTPSKEEQLYNTNSVEEYRMVKQKLD
ncbi:MAG: molybdenum cofactor guanylyltransferase [Croceivirga sp.]